MSPRQLVALAVVVVALAGLYGSARSRAGEPAARHQAAAPAGTFTFDAGVSELNRRAWLAAVGRVRPEAAQLFARVAGRVTVVDAEVPQGALAVTARDGDHHTITLRFGSVYQQLGQRGFDRVIHHELGHVIDAELLDDALRAQLDAGIPPGQPCTSAVPTGSCAPRAERFAESFAKWANGDIGVNLYAGYLVPPPPDLEAWGRPLAALAAG